MKSLYTYGLILMLCCTLAWTAEAPTTVTAKDLPADIAAQMPTITISAQSYYLMGSTVPITLEYLRLATDRVSTIDETTLLPSSEFTIDISDADGKAVPRKRVHDQEIMTPRCPSGATPPNPEDIFYAKPGEQFLFSCDLAAVFEFPQAGRYTLAVVSRQSSRTQRIILATAEIHLYDTTKVVDVKGIEAPFTATVGQADIDGTPTRFLHVTYPYTRVGGSKPETRSADLPLRANTTVKTAQRDYRNALWFLLDTGTERSLMVFDTEHQQFCTLIPWGQAQIEFGTVQSNIDSTKVVIAGVAGKPRITSTSLAGLLQQPQTVQLP